MALSVWRRRRSRDAVPSAPGRVTVDPVFDHEATLRRVTALAETHARTARRAAAEAADAAYWDRLDAERRLRIYAEREDDENGTRRPESLACTGNWVWEVSNGFGSLIAGGLSGTWDCARDDGCRVLADLTSPVDQ